ncbi:MAG: helix-turn-helix transcriptional regulator [Candidatus Thorarchaeota archaeon]|jgi:hypothetical protein
MGTSGLPDTLKGIEIEKDSNGKVLVSYAGTPKVVFITDQERAEVIDDEVRYTIIRILRKGIPDTQTTEEYNEETGERIIRQKEITRHEMSVVEIVKMSQEHEEIEEISKNQVYHHLPILIDAGYIVKYGTVTTGKRTTDYYRRTSRGFVLPKYTTTQNKKMLKQKYTKLFQRMVNAFDLGLTDEDVQELVKLRLNLFELEEDSRNKLVDLVRSDVADDALLDMYEWLVGIHSAGKKEYYDKVLEIHKFLFKE